MQETTNRQFRSPPQTEDSVPGADFRSCTYTRQNDGHPQGRAKPQKIGCDVQPTIFCRRAVYRQRYNFHHRNTGNQCERQKKSPLLLLIQGLAQPCKESHKSSKQKDRWWLKPNNIRSWQSVSLFSNPNAARISWNPPLRFLHYDTVIVSNPLFSRQLRDEAFAVRFSTFLSPACSNANTARFFG